MPLRIVHALTWFDGMTYPYPELDVPGQLSGGAQSVLQAMSDLVADSAAGRRACSTSAVDGHPVDVLVAASEGASLLVVGGRGVGGLAGLLLGSTAHGVVAHAACPVVVLPDDTAVQARDRRSVVVGVRGRGDDEALAFAFAEAAARGTDLVAVHAWQDVVLETSFLSTSPLVDWAGVQADEERVLAEALAGWSEKDPDVVVREVVIRERTARALVEASLTAQLLVLGRSRHRTLGSTTNGALHRAGCPVAVVPAPGERQPMTAHPTRVLVVVASRHGATAEIGAALARSIQESRRRGLAVVPMPVDQRPDPAAFDAVVVGSAVYAGEWLEPAREYVTTHADVLRTRPLWLFSSGPIGDPPFPLDEPYDVAALTHLTGARGHVDLPRQAGEGAAVLRGARHGHGDAGAGRGLPRLGRRPPLGRGDRRARSPVSASPRPSGRDRARRPMQG